VKIEASNEPLKEREYIVDADKGNQFYLNLKK